MLINDADIEVFFALPFHVYWKDNEGFYRGCNDYQAMNLGFKSGTEIIGYTDLDLPWKKEQALEYRKNDIATLNKNSPILIKEPISLINGNSFEALSYKIPLHDHSMKKKGVLGFTLLSETTQHLQILSEFTKLQTTEGGLTTSKTSSKPLKKNAQDLNLTSRQMDCLCYLVQGYSIKLIAHALEISPRTVEHYLENIKAKLNCNSKSDLIKLALRVPSIQTKLLEYIS